MSNLAYVRVSTIEQNPTRQKRIIKETAVIDKWFIEKISGGSRDRPELIRLLDYVRKDDTIYVESLDRFARNTKDLLDMAEYLIEKNVNLYFIKDNLKLDNSPNGKLMITILSAIAEFDRNISKRRQAEGIAIAKEKGLYKGRKPIPINKKQFEELYDDWKNEYITQKQFYKRLNISRTTLYRRIKKYENELEKNDKER